MKNNKLSIVIPVYNEEGNIENFVNELKDTLQNNKIPYEIILVNDNSADGTKNIITNLREKNKNFS